MQFVAKHETRLDLPELKGTMKPRTDLILLVGRADSIGRRWLTELVCISLNRAYLAHDRDQKTYNVESVAERALAGAVFADTNRRDRKCQSRVHAEVIRDSARFAKLYLQR
jgi:hypothetical protein